MASSNAERNSSLQKKKERINPRRRSRFKAALQPGLGLKGVGHRGRGKLQQAAIRKRRAPKRQAAGTKTVKSEVLISKDDLVICDRKLLNRSESN